MSGIFDEAAGHKHFSSACFNATWTWIDRADRTEEETEAMIHASHASLHHWRSRADVADLQLSVGYWQLSRVYSVARRGEEALRYGLLSLEAARRGALEPFYSAYAREALARAAALLGRRAEAASFLEEAREDAARVMDAESRKALESDLSGIAL
ncbi:MAG TPA: hypothetical protein PKW82_08420 [Spirochaetales bacterium]|nr:hypothetical protein [Spirochaetales bacterium]